MTTPRFIKLTPRNRTVGGFTQLWLAPDHILLLTSSRIAEEYKRFAFSDIQSIVVTELPSRVIAQVMMILAALAWMSLWFAVDSRFAKWALEITGVLALLVPIADIARGPRCRCYLHTRVSKERLVPVSRMKTAGSFLAAIRPLIEAVQGALPREAIAAIEIPYSAPDEPPPPEIVSSPGYLPEILFGTFLLNAVLIWASVKYPKLQDLSGVLINTLVAEALLIVAALVRRKGRDARVVTYVVIVLAVIGFGFDISTIARTIFGWYMTLIEKAKNGDKSLTVLTIFPNYGKGAIIASAWRAIAGVVGLAAAFYERSRGIKR